MLWGKNLHVYPIVMAVYLPVSFIITYAIAVALKHVEPGFPYISETGSLSPESCVFGQLLNIYAVMVAVAMYIRYKQIDIQCSRLTQQCMGNLTPVKRRIIVNKVCFGIGLVGALGSSMVANFQESRVIIVHIVGALFAFALSAVYMWIQVVISCRMRSFANLRSSDVAIIWRIIISSIHLVSFISMMVATKISLDQFDGDNPKMWTPNNKGYGAHLVATITEWIVALCVSAYFLTFVGDFRKLGLEVKCFELNESTELYVVEPAKEVESITMAPSVIPS